MKVHRMKIKGKSREYMCLNEFKNPEGCPVCYLDKVGNLVESRLKAPKNIETKCKTCDNTLVSFLDLPNDQKIALWNKEELDTLVQERIYCPKCKIAYLYMPKK